MQQVTSHHVEPLNHTLILWVTRKSAKLTGATRNEVSQGITIVTNGVTAPFKPCQGANPFEIHTANLEQI